MPDYVVFGLLSVLLLVLSIVGFLGKGPAFIGASEEGGNPYDQRKLSRAGGVFTLVIGIAIAGFAYASYQAEQNGAVFDSFVPKAALVIVAIAGLAVLVWYANAHCRKQ